MIRVHRRMHPMKQFMEARLGKPMTVTDRGAFIRHDREVLQFSCLWNNSDRLYGDVLLFKLNYYCPG